MKKHCEMTNELSSLLYDWLDSSLVSMSLCLLIDCLSPTEKNKQSEALHAHHEPSCQGNKMQLGEDKNIMTELKMIQD